MGGWKCNGATISAQQYIPLPNLVLVNQPSNYRSVPHRFSAGLERASKLRAAGRKGMSLRVESGEQEMALPGGVMRLGHETSGLTARDSRAFGAEFAVGAGKWPQAGCG